MTTNDQYIFYSYTPTEILCQKENDRSELPQIEYYPTKDQKGIKAP